MPAKFSGWVPNVETFTEVESGSVIVATGKEAEQDMTYGGGDPTVVVAAFGLNGIPPETKNQSNQSWTVFIYSVHATWIVTDIHKYNKIVCPLTQ